MKYILDAAALLNNENFSFDEGNKYYTTSLVFAEWKDFRSKALAQNAESQGLLIVMDPCTNSIQITYDKLAESNTEMSDADSSLLALAIEFKQRKNRFVVITDDYSIQNVLKKLKINFQGVAQREIKEHRVFKKSV